MAVERILAPETYIPVDVVSRDSRTRVIDLNGQSLPVDWLKGMELATVLGVIEYLHDPESLLSAIAAAGVGVVASYHVTDLPGVESRANEGWLNAFDAASIEAMARRQGLQPIFRYVFDKKQMVWLWLPEGVEGGPGWPDGCRAKPVRAANARCGWIYGSRQLRG